MSRSYRHRPIFGIAIARSEKSEKREANRKLRRRTRMLLRGWQGNEEPQPPLLREVSNVWSFSKDGKNYWRGATDRDMRK
jgi:hypothetical protein